LERPSPDLLDVVDDVLTRQSWYREYAQSSGFDALDFVGRLTPDVDPVQAAAQIRERHGLTPELRASAASWEEALRLEVERIESSGVLVMRNGVVGNNTSRPLDVGEFRGFAIADDLAPVIFLNGRDAKAAQMFTLMHELVHIWLGRSGVSNLNMTLPVANETERVSNRVAAEILVPRAELDDAWAIRRGNPAAVSQMARLFKVSSLVILRRLLDTGQVEVQEFRERYAAEEDRFRAAGGRDDAGGGDFYRTQTIRTSRRFATTLIAATLEGKTSRRDAFRLLGIRSPSTFEEFARRLGLVA
jgi:Zn-dependent peptidase ImmA (M78 family)